MLMKIRALLVALLLIASLVQAVAATPPKAGAVCNKAGSIKNSNGKKFTCIKSGKKLVTVLESARVATMMLAPLF